MGMLWVVLFTINISILVDIGKEAITAGAVTSDQIAWKKWTEILVIVYMAFAYAATALFGAGIISTGFLTGWAGWVAVVTGVAGVLSMVFLSRWTSLPLLIHIVPFVWGLMMLRR